MKTLGMAHDKADWLSASTHLLISRGIISHIHPNPRETATRQKKANEENKAGQPSSTTPEPGDDEEERAKAGAEELPAG
ncbi:hypothetical protein MMC10_007297 [Thelotrema lepadinum]|nr:hypothetical protein [Thelotrema lepadinum]